MNAGSKQQQQGVLVGVRLGRFQRGGGVDFLFYFFLVFLF